MTDIDKILCNGSFLPLWLQNNLRNAERLKPEVQEIGRRWVDRIEKAPLLSRRSVIRAGAAACAATLAEYVGLQESYSRGLFGNGGVAGTGGVTFTKITNGRTGTTFQYIYEAVYDPTQLTGDIIHVPGGLAAPDYLATPYAYWQHLDPPGQGPNGMSIGPGFTVADYLTIQGEGTNTGSWPFGRAVISMPYGILAADLHSGDSVIQLDATGLNPGASLFKNPGGIGTGIYVWGQGSALDYQMTAIGALLYNGISGNNLTGLSFPGGMPTIPAGTMIVGQPVNGKAPFNCWGLNPGITFNNLELGPSGGDFQTGPIRAGGSGGLQPGIGSFTTNNCFFHDFYQGAGLNAGALEGTGTHEYFFNTELFRCGVDFRTHNLYCGEFDELILSGCRVHQTGGTHEVKCRARTAIIEYTAIAGEQTGAGNNSSCIDLSQGCLLYVIGSPSTQGLQPATTNIQFNAEGGLYLANPNSSALAHPRQETYIVNDALVGPATGAGRNTSQIAPINLLYGGVVIPQFNAPISTVSGGSLPDRYYVYGATCTTAAGGETGISPVGLPYGIGSFAGSGPYIPIAKVAASNRIVIPSPSVVTGADKWHAYMNRLDPVVYNPDYLGTPASNYWDTAHTLPIFSYINSGSLPSSPYALLCGFTYHYPDGTESANLAAQGIPFTSLGGSAVPWLDGTFTTADPLTATVYLNGAWASTPGANQLLVAASPPGDGLATGWSFWCTPLPYNHSGTTAAGTVIPLTRQNRSGPIPIGTDFTEDATFGIRSSQVLMPNMYRQDSGAGIAFGTSFTEPTGGLANNNPVALKWERRIGATINGIAYTGVDIWWAVAPSPLTNYVEKAYPQKATNVNAVIVAIKGALSTTWPFDAANPQPAFGGTSGTPITWDATNGGVAIGGFRDTAGTAGSGWTQAYLTGTLMAEYRVFASGVGSTTLTRVGGGAVGNAVDFVITGAGGGVDGTATVASTGDIVTFSPLTTTQSNDILVMIAASDASTLQDVLIAVGQIGPPPVLGAGLNTSGPSTSPAGIIMNNATSNYSGAGVLGLVNYYGLDASAVFTNLTIANNVPVNQWNGSGFNSPLNAAVFVDAPNQDYRPLVGSVLRGAAAPPGSSPEGRSLVATFENKFAVSGLPAPGTPLTLTARPTISDAGAYEYGV